MRIVGGTARGRALRAPRGQSTRPTSDRVRESVFDILTAMDVVEGARVLDLFAGTGALGIEAMSRLADSAVLVDSAPDAVVAMRENLAVLGGDAGRVEVVRADALAYARRAGWFDLVFADPPYAFTDWEGLFGALEGRCGLLVAEAAAAAPSRVGAAAPSLPPEPGTAAGEGFPSIPGRAWETVKVRRYGGTVVLVARPVHPSSPPGVVDRHGEV